MENINRPSKEEILKRISEIENLDLKTVEIDEIKNLLGLISTGYVLSTPFFDPGLELYRGIPYKSKPEKLSHLSYPPKKFAKINRASRENEPMFYCSTFRNVTFFELDLISGEKLVVSKWKTRKQLLVNNIGYTDSNFSNLNSNRSNQKWDQEKSKNPEITKEENIIVQNFLAKTFSQEITKNTLELCKLTIAISERHYVNDFLQGLLYPTISMNANADNFALKPSFIDSGGLTFEEVEYIEIKNVHNFNYDINILDWANSISKKGEIEWKRRLPKFTSKLNNGKLEWTKW